MTTPRPQPQPRHQSQPVPLDSPELLAAALREQGMSPGEADEAVPALLRLAAWRAPGPSPEHVAHLLAELAPLVPAAAQLAGAAPAYAAPGLATRLAAGARIALRQARLIHPGLWLGSALALASVALYAAVLRDPRQAAGMVAFALPLVLAGGAAFLYGREADPALEIALATPTSPRRILLSRVALVLGFDALLALGATALVAALHHAALWPLVGLWLGPAALLSSGSLLLSLLAGPVVAAASACAAALGQAFQLGDHLRLQFAFAPLWQTDPLTLALAAVLLLLAVVYVPRQERVARQSASSVS